ncbi:MAG: helix-turn-helix domain-containing protein [Prevotellaceae bacterium]|jgi:transcriptional regulator with XRE-family HTH domain|nr:helix-turn-helix domain-containing protein [Prevotellaceae bacterium]
MLSAKRIKQLWEELQIPQRQLAAALEIETPMYSKIERGERPTKREQILTIAGLLKADEIAIVGEEKEFARKAFKVAQQKINQI